MKRLVHALFVASLTVSVFAHTPTNVAANSAGTVVDGDIKVNTTWTPAGSPYSVKYGLNVHANATLTILPGTTVRLKPSSSHRVAAGAKLIAEGSSTEPVKFECSDECYASHADAPWETHWRDITIAEGATIRLGNCEVSNGWYVALAAPDTVIHDCVFNKMHIYGLWISTPVGGGINSTVRDTRFSSIGAHAIRISNSDPQLANLTLSGDESGRIELDLGEVQSNLYTYNLEAANYEVHSLNIRSGSTIVVQPGSVLSFLQGGIGYLRGKLIANGTPLAPIRFTSVLTQPKAGDWGGLQFPAKFASDPELVGRNELSNCVIEYADVAIAAYRNLDVTKCEISQNNGAFRGLWTQINQTYTATFGYNSIHSNAQGFVNDAPLTASSGVVITARQNFRIQYLLH